MEPDLPVSVKPAILLFPRKIRWKAALGSPDPVFYGTFGGPKNGPQEGRAALLGSPGGSGPAARATKTVVSLKRNATFHKTARSTDRLVALPGRLNLTPRLRGEVDLRGGRGRVKKCDSPMRNRRF